MNRALHVVVTVAAAVLGACAAKPADDAGGSGGFRGRALATPITKPGFTLQDVRGRPFDFRRETSGDLTMLYFGYTNCPDVCPVQLGNLAAVLRDMPYEVTSRTKVVFVTVDPERDTPERIRDWLGRIDAGFIGLRGDPAQVARIERSVGVAPALPEPTATSGSAMGHAAQVIAFTPDGLAHVVYPFGTRQEDWAVDIPRLLATYAGPGAGASDHGR